jgi:hypothetical protein
MPAHERGQRQRDGDDHRGHRDQSPPAPLSCRLHRANSFIHQFRNTGVQGAFESGQECVPFRR